MDLNENLDVFQFEEQYSMTIDDLGSHQPLDLHSQNLENRASPRNNMSFEFDYEESKDQKQVPRLKINLGSVYPIQDIEFDIDRDQQLLTDRTKPATNTLVGTQLDAIMFQSARQNQKLQRSETFKNPLQKGQSALILSSSNVPVKIHEKLRQTLKIKKQLSPTKSLANSRNSQQMFQSQTSISAVSQFSSQTATSQKVRIFEWYFYPEFAHSSLFKGSHKQPKFSEFFDPKNQQNDLKYSRKESYAAKNSTMNDESIESFQNSSSHSPMTTQNETPKKAARQQMKPLVIVQSVKKIKNLHKNPSLALFEQSELSASFKQIFSDKQVPFKYRTFKYLTQILYSKEVEQDIKDFKRREDYVRKHWKLEKTIDRDVSRTNFLRDNPKFHIEIKRVVEFYCYALNVSYCQGMLEVILPFMYIKTTGQGDFDLASVYAFFKQFVRNFIPNNLHSKFNGRSAVLPYIKCTLHLTTLVLSYYDRELLTHLQRKRISIEMFATNWVTTLFTRVVQFNLIYELWEIFLFERDQYFIFYFAVALLVSHRDYILLLTKMDALIKLLQKIFINDLVDLQETYQRAIQIRKQMPVSFQVLVQRLGIFTYNPIISNEELQLVENTNLREVMPIYSMELIVGSQQWLAQQPVQNNEKFKNLLFLSENEQQIYLAPSSSEGSKIDRDGTLASQNPSSEDCESALNKSEIMDPLFKITTMKFMTSSDLKVATSVKFTLLDIRTIKRPKLIEIFKDAKGGRREDAPAIFEIDISKRTTLKSQDLDKLVDQHIVIVCSEFGDNNLPFRPQEHELMRRILEITKKQSFVGLLQGGASELFITREEMKIITL